jgi:hypothetical protein
MNRLIALVFFGVISVRAFGAPCCGGTANVPSLISGDDRMQVSTTLSSSNVVAEAPVGGGIRFRSDSDTEIAQTLRIDAALLLSDRIQSGITIPVIRRNRMRGSTEAGATGLGDIALSLGYEVLPDWSYSVWRPKGIIFLSANLPTGGSIYDSTQLYRIDSRGKGFFSLSAGALLLKSWGNWDVSLLAEGHRSFSRSISNEMGVLTLTPGWGASGTLSVGYSPFSGAVRIGIGLSPSIEEPVTTEGLVVGEGEKQALWAASAQLSYMASDDLSMSLTYSDQTIIRASENAALNRTFAFLVQKRFER